MGIRRVENMCGGKGHVIIKDILEGDELKGKCGLYAQVTIEKGCSLGYHEHHGETETYYILSGEGEYDDNGVKRPVKAGDITITPDGKEMCIRDRSSTWIPSSMECRLTEDLESDWNVLPCRSSEKKTFVRPVCSHVI